MTITDERLRPERNNLTLVRLVLASAVIVTHCYWRVYNVSGQDGLSRWLGVPLSVYAVDGFFFLSGFLVYGSLERRANAGRFITARLTRMMPGLLVSVSLTVLAGALVTPLAFPVYMTGETMKFVFYNLTLLGGHYSLSGIMCGAHPCIINGSLWTLHWEALFYLVLAGLALVGMSGRKWMVRLILPATLIGAFACHVPAINSQIGISGGKGALYFAENIDRLWTLFALGIAARIWKGYIRLSWRGLGALFILNLIAHHWNVNIHVQTVFVGYAILCCGFLSARKRAVSGGWPDYSYGIYIYAFPAMMAVGSLADFDNALILAAINFLCVIPLAVFSWHLIEKPALDLIRDKRRTGRKEELREASAAHRLGHERPAG
ncbi:acyltransferase [Sphingobium limneticum]|uniref:acyltransferase family protein n=1 Tax=Sphingobium limneticum TaxID=1007511 RepID=UPI00123CA3BD|nr:acyltransferase [Sphingobium limneticum]KAA9013007.1 acyltransferase [Sphingobium limneticum]